MYATTKAALITAFAVITLVLLLFGSGMATGTMMSGEMMGAGSMGGVNDMWLVTFLVVALGAVMVYVAFRK